jgi:hypothetical protein
MKELKIGKSKLYSTYVKNRLLSKALFINGKPDYQEHLKQISSVVK